MSLHWTQNGTQMQGPYAHIEDCADEGNGMHYYAALPAGLNPDAAADLAEEDFLSTADYNGKTKCSMWVYGDDGQHLIAKRTFTAGD